MATYYVNSGAAGAGTGADWTNAFTTVTAALSGRSTGDILLVHNAHTVTAGAAVTWTVPSGNIAIICVDKDNSDAWSTGASEAVGASNSGFSIASNSAGSNVFLHGMTLVAGTNNSGSCNINFNTGSAGILSLRAQSCTFTLSSGTTATASMNIGANSGANTRSASVYLTDCTIRTNNATSGSSIYLTSCRVHFNNVTLALAVGGNKPDTLFRGTASPHNSIDVLVQNSDLSAFNDTANGLVDASIGGGIGRYVFANCKISSNTSAKINTFVASGDMTITFLNTDDADTINNFEHYSRTGSLTIDAANYFTTGGASFNASPLSWKIVTTAVCDEFNPFMCPSLYRWNTSTASTDFNVQSIWDSASDYTDAEVWLGVSYAGTASFPTGAYATDRDATPFVSAGADQENGTNGSWTTSGITNTNEQQLKVTATPAEVGLVEGVVYVTKASATIWIDPMIRVALP